MWMIDRCRRSRLSRLVVAVSLLSAIALPVAAQEARFTGADELVRPTGYREWTYIGTPLTPNDMNDGKAAFPEFHNVYISPNAWAAYRRTGEFPEGTVLVKELISVGTKQATSGRGYFMGDFIGLEAAVKDAGRFPGAPGHWAYFSFGHSYPLASVARPRPLAECSACHAANAAQDYVFTQYYPVIRAAHPDARDARTAPARGASVEALGR